MPTFTMVDIQDFIPTQKHPRIKLPVTAKSEKLKQSFKWLNRKMESNGIRES